MAIITLAEAKTHLNINDASHDAELQGFVDTAQPIVEKIVGPVVSAAATEYYDGGASRISLRRRPVISVETVKVFSPSSGTITLTQVGDPSLAVQDSYTVNLDTGEIVRRTTRGIEVCFNTGHDGVQIAYTAGRAVVPANVRLGALEIVRHLYQQTQQGGRPSLGADETDGDVIVLMGFAVPKRVIELLRPHRRTPGIA